MSPRKWRLHYNVLKRFSPGYNPRAGVVDLAVSSPNGSGSPGTLLSPEESYWCYQERGVDLPSFNPVLRNEYLERKAGMDLTISMWKETIRDMQASDLRINRWLGPRAMVMELAVEFPVSFLDRIGLLKMAGLTIRQLGMSMGRC